MIIRRIVCWLLPLTLVISCNPVSYISEVDPVNYHNNASQSGITVKEHQEMGRILHDSILKSTIGRTLPPVKVFTLDGRELELGDEIGKMKQDYIIIVSNAHCGFGVDGISTIFPNSQAKYEADFHKVTVFALVLRTEADIADSTRMYKLIKEIKPLYPSVYIIDYEDVMKLNMLGNPTRFYMNKHNVVKFMKVGIPGKGDMYNEIRDNID